MEPWIQVILKLCKAAVSGALDSGDPKIMLDAIIKVEELYQALIDDASQLFEEEYKQGWQHMKDSNGKPRPVKAKEVSGGPLGTDALDGYDPKETWNNGKLTDEEEEERIRLKKELGK